MKQSQLPSVNLLRDRFDGRPFRVAEAVEAGVSRSTLYRLLQDGNLVAAGRGVMRLPDAGVGTLSGLAAVSARVPGGTICLNSALSFWDLTDEIPERIHLAVPRGARPPKIDQPPTIVHVFDADTYDIDRRQEHTDTDEPFWVYSAERSIVDAMRMSRWVGRDVALQALRRLLNRPGSDPARVAELAREFGVIGQIQPALATLLS